jgi:ABC-type multidrug transport system fused ATPase/permease subunit
MKIKFKEIYFLLSRKNRIKLYISFLLLFLSSILDLLGVVSVLPFLSLLVEPELINTNRYLIKINSYLGFNNKELIIFFGFSSFCLIFFNQITRFLSKIYAIYFCRNLIFEMTNQVFDYYLSKPYGFFLRQNQQHLVQKCTTYVEALIAGTLSPFILISAQFLTTLIIFTFLVLYQTQIIAVLILILLVYYFLIFKKVSKKYNLISKNYSNYFEGFSRALGDAFGVIQQLKFADNDYFRKRFKHSSELYKKANIHQNFYGMLPSYFIEVVAYGTILIVSIVLFFQSDNLSKVIPILGVLTISIRRIFPGLQEIYAQVLQIKFHSEVYKKIYPDLKKIVKRKEINRAKRNQIIFSNNINCENINYSYKKSKSKITINAKFYKNEFVGICGTTGSGKTTFMNILSGLIKPKKGKIYCDGLEVKTYGNPIWRKKIGYVPQNRFILNDTILHNISLGKKLKIKDQKKINKICKIVDLNNLLRKYNKGYNTFIGDNGLKLSGGQEQKIIIARALFNDPEILIFDEGTNALDVISENKIINNIRKYYQNLTIIFITHRVNALKRCDKIIFIQNSKVKKIANYRSLVKESNFKKLILKN